MFMLLLVGMNNFECSAVLAVSFIILKMLFLINILTTAGRCYEDKNAKGLFY